MDVSVGARQPHHLNGLVRLFHAPYEHNGYPVEGPPDWKAPESWLQFFAGSATSSEILGLVACQGDEESDAQHPDGSSDNVNNGDGREDGGMVEGDEGRVLGHVSLRRVSRGSIVFQIWCDITGNRNAEDELWEVCRFAVDPAVQGKGLGGMLLGAVESKGQREEKPLFLGVLEKDVAAIRMYDKRGWIKAGQDKMVGRDGRVWVEYFYKYPAKQRHDK